MCGRYATTVDPALLAVELDAIDETAPSATSPASSSPAPTEHYNVAPTDPVPVVVARHDRERPDTPPTRRIRTMRWGLLPPWTKAADDGTPVRSAPLFNARADTVTDKPAFRAAVRTKRALVPMDGWYEWTTEPTAAGKAVKVPHYMTPRDGSTLFMAGLWSVWHAPGPASPLLSCTILTTDAVGALRDVHDRMPLILTPEHWDRWLDPDAGVPADLLAAGVTDHVAAGIEIRTVSGRVNNVRNDGPDLIAPAAPPGSAVGEQITLL